MHKPAPISPRRRREETPKRSAGRGGVSHPTTRSLSLPRPHPHPLPIAHCLLPLLLLLLPACAERRIRVTSEPTGARVWLNDEDIGRTPTEARFTFYGHYDLRLELPGHEPYHAEHTARAPFREYPGPDLVTTALPGDFHHTVPWHVVLTPSPETVLDPETVRLELIDRAGALREQAQSTPQD